jgi:hypothetical protein
VVLVAGLVRHEHDVAERLCVRIDVPDQLVDQILPVGALRDGLPDRLVLEDREVHPEIDVLVGLARRRKSLDRLVAAQLLGDRTTGLDGNDVDLLVRSEGDRPTSPWSRRIRPIRY